MSKPEGKIVQFDELNEHGLVLKLDNGTTVRVSANPRGLYLHVSGIEGGLRVAELPDASLSNFVNLQFDPFDSGGCE